MCELEWHSMMPQKMISHKKPQKTQEEIQNQKY
jgi:hypothetical protein